MLGFSPLAVGPLGALPRAQSTTLSGSLNTTLGSLAASGISTLLLRGQLSTELGGLSLSSAGAVALRASSTATLGSLGLTASGASILSGSLVASLGPLVSAAAGKVLVQAAAAATLGNLTATASAISTQPIVGSLVGQLSSLTGLASGALVIRGTLAGSLDGLSVLAAGRSNSATPIRYLTFLAQAKNVLFSAKTKRLAFTAYVDGDKIVERTPEKQPEEIWLCALDCSAWIGEGNSITAFSALTVSGSVVADNAALLPNGIGHFRLSGGKSKEIAKVRALATMADGQVFGQTFLVAVE